MNLELFTINDMASQNRLQKKDMTTEMLPPPLPQKKILEVEVTVLGHCFRNAVVKTGQIYNFYADTSRLGIHTHAPNPPRSLTGSLGHEIEKFDQLCDAIETRLLRATAVLKRDLQREENRIEAAKAVEPVASKPLSPVMGTAPSSPHSIKPTEQSPIQSTASGRRPSTISLSSLHRPTFQHKLDLSSLRLNPEDLISLSTGTLASPVTLAPRSARPLTSNELSAELMAAFASPETASNNNHTVDIDLTLDSDPPSEALNTVHSSSNIDEPSHIDHTLGSSADKPIELDLDIDMADMQDMSHIFGENTNNTNVEILFSQSDDKKDDDDAMGMEILDEFSSTVGNSTEVDNNIFASIGAESTDQESNNNMTIPSNLVAPSPGSLLDSFNNGNNGNLASSSIPGAESPFDLNSIDLSNIDSGFLMASSSDMKLMEELFKLESDPSATGANQ